MCSYRDIVFVVEEEQINRTIQETMQKLAENANEAEVRI